MSHPLTTFADLAAAADFGTDVATERARRIEREAREIAWRAFSDYVARPDHDTRSEEYARLEAALAASS